MVGPTVVGRGRFEASPRGEHCIAVTVADRLDNEGLLVDEYNSTNPFVRLTTEIEDYARRAGVLTTRFLGVAAVKNLDNVNVRVVDGNVDVVTRGCTPEVDVVKQRSTSFVECPKDPSQQCSNCFHKLIGVLQAETDTFAPDGSPESDAYTEALAQVEAYTQEHPAQGETTVENVEHSLDVFSQRIDLKINDIESYLANVRQVAKDLRSKDPTTRLRAQLEAQRIGANAKRSLEFRSVEMFGIDGLVLSALEKASSLKDLQVVPFELLNSTRQAGTKLVTHLVHRKADALNDHIG